MTIKRSPDDFRVEEVLSDPLARSIRPDSGPFALYLLEKSSLATPDAVAAFARQLAVPVAAVTYAGLKDKHALTIQHVAVDCARLRPSAELPAALSGKGWSASRLGWIDSPLDSSAIARNRFRITLRDLSPDASTRMESRARLLSAHATPSPAHLVTCSPVPPPEAALLVVNYFGDQRFGSSRHLQGFPAALLLKGDYEGALRLAIATEARKDDRRRKERTRLIVESWGRWSQLASRLPRGCPERPPVEALARGGDFRAAFVALPYFFQRMAVQAYQSFLWNEIARDLVETACGGPRAMLTYDGRFGKMSFPHAANVPSDLVDLDLPVLGYKSELKAPWNAAAERVLTREGLTGTDALRIRGVRRPFFGEAPRNLFVSAERFDLSATQPDASAPESLRLLRQLSFDLPRGAYATTLLRALGQ